MEYLPFVFGFTRLLLGIAIFLKVFEVFGDNKPNSVFDKKPGLLTATAVFLIGSGLYTIFFSDADSYRVGAAKEEWTLKDKETLNLTCLRDLKTLVTEFPQESKQYCSCGVETITANIPKEQYLESLKKPMSEQAQVQFKYFKDCFTTFEAQVKQGRKLSKKSSL